ncbi:MAG: hypothetical protein CME62_08385 [Halobacteriovoraceae bacterium]|nr:hypothetical protein [Halobacteriovoraceae bacterium]|tara:strand:- start:7374 stop:7895 length:522 start_codon:yes stop_codon:yes gene_type:complete
MSRKRSIRNKKQRHVKNRHFEIDITSLLDILVILLVFLLKSYNSSGITVEVPKEIKLPYSKSDSLNSAGVMIQVSKDKIWVDSETIFEATDDNKNVYGHGGRLINPLYNNLVKKVEEIKTLNRQEPDVAKEFSGVANLIIDKTLKYSYVKKIMYTCAEAGFKTYKFVVLSEED